MTTQFMPMTRRRPGRSAKVTPQDVIEIRREYAEGSTQGQLARKWGLGVGQIGKIVRGEAWAEITGNVPVITAVEAQLNGIQMSTLQGQGQSYFEAQTKGMMERLLKVQEEVDAGREDALDTEASKAADARYRRLMGMAEIEAEAMEPQVTEAGQAALERLSNAAQAQAQANINAGRLLDELKNDEGEH